MFGGNNGNPVFPVFLDGNQLHYNTNASTQLQLFGNLPMAINLDPVNYVGNDQVSLLNQPNKRSSDNEDATRQEMLQISLNNFCQNETDPSATMPKRNVVSTGLRLSYDDDEHNSSVTSASANIPSLPVMLSLGDDLRAEIEQQKEEFDHFIRVQEEQIVKGVKEMRQKHTASFLNAVEKGVSRKLKEKEMEIENINRKNKELAERIKQVAMEAQSWHYRARYNESVVNVLRSNLNKAMAQGADQLKEGCGDSEVDDAASSYHPNLLLPGMLGKTKKGLSEQMACKACRSKEVCMLLLPCRHLCLCQDCDRFIEACPVCQTVKTTTSVQVYLS